MAGTAPKEMDSGDKPLTLFQAQELREASEIERDEMVCWSGIQVKRAQQLFHSTAYSDLTISCRGHEWKVHKFQLCAQSEYFSTLFASGFKEAQENRISLDDDSPGAIAALLWYCYTAKYISQNIERDGPSPLLFDTRNYLTGDKFLVSGLSELSYQSFTKQCRLEWMSPAFSEAVALIYDHGPERSHLKTTVVETARSHLTELYADRSKYKEFHELLLATPSFALDLLAVMSKQPLDYDVTLSGICAVHVQLKCPYDGSIFKTHCCIGQNSSIKCPDGHEGSFLWWKPHQVHSPVPDKYEVHLKCPGESCGKFIKTQAYLGRATSVVCGACGKTALSRKHMVITQ